jgi:hypothetical protein
MDPFHERLARLALEAAADYGFCLAGGYAVQAHGFVDRVSKDVDLFTTMAAVEEFPAARTAVVTALEADGLAVSVERESATFARLAVSDPSLGESSTLELGVDWRAFPPVQLAIGPVLHPVDAAANKLCALFGRAAVRDYIDVHGVSVMGATPVPSCLRWLPNMIQDSTRGCSQRRYEPSPGCLPQPSSPTSFPPTRSMRCASASSLGRRRSRSAARSGRDRPI